MINGPYCPCCRACRIPGLHALGSTGVLNITGCHPTPLTYPQYDIPLIKTFNDIRVVCVPEDAWDIRYHNVFGATPTHCQYSTAADYAKIVMQRRAMQPAVEGAVVNIKFATDATCRVRLTVCASDDTGADGYWAEFDIANRAEPMLRLGHGDTLAAQYRRNALTAAFSHIHNSVTLQPCVQINAERTAARLLNASSNPSGSGVQAGPKHNTLWNLPVPSDSNNRIILEKFGPGRIYFTELYADHNDGAIRAFRNQTGTSVLPPGPLICDTARVPRCPSPTTDGYLPLRVTATFAGIVDAAACCPYKNSAFPSPASTLNGLGLVLTDGRYYDPLYTQNNLVASPSCTFGRFLLALENGICVASVPDTSAFPSSALCIPITACALDLFYTGPASIWHAGLGTAYPDIVPASGSRIIAKLALLPRGDPPSTLITGGCASFGSIHYSKWFGLDLPDDIIDPLQTYVLPYLPDRTITQLPVGGPTYPPLGSNPPADFSGATLTIAPLADTS